MENKNDSLRRLRYERRYNKNVNEFIAKHNAGLIDNIEFLVECQKINLKYGYRINISD